MANTEIDSFVLKFKYLCHAGYKASLSLESDNGEAFVSLKAGLGFLPPPLLLPPAQGHDHGQHLPSIHRGPAYARRQEKRRAAAKQPAEAEKALDSSSGSEHVANDEDSEITEEVIGTEDVETANKEAEQADANFECIICDFKSKWQNGLNVHMSRKHGNVEQIDGMTDIIELENDEKYENTKHYWEKGRLGTVYQCFNDANAIIDNCSEFSEEDKKKERLKVLEARKSAFGVSYNNFPPWCRS